jgi:hypothetical protein
VGEDGRHGGPGPPRPPWSPAIPLSQAKPPASVRMVRDLVFALTGVAGVSGATALNSRSSAARLRGRRQASRGVTAVSGRRTARGSGPEGQGSAGVQGFRGTDRNLPAPLDHELDADAQGPGRGEPAPRVTRDPGCWTPWAILSHRRPRGGLGTGWELDPSLTRKRPLFAVREPWGSREGAVNPVRLPCHGNLRQFAASCGFDGRSVSTRKRVPRRAINGKRSYVHRRAIRRGVI